MESSTNHARERIEALAAQTGFSSAAVDVMARAFARGGGRMAQFDHAEFGGPGQWMHGGMLMISDFSDHALQRRVGALCEALASGGFDTAATARTGASAADLFEPEEPWYPASLGTPDSSGSQNHARYAWFADRRRLAIDDGHGVVVYDTGDHRIGGVSQQQGTGGTVSFVSQHGNVDVGRLPIVDEGWRSSPPASAPRPVPSSHDPFVAIEKLADLHARGVLDDAEFAAKKAELLQRI